MEIFGPTMQGEGLMNGTVTHFLRTGGCGLRCSWCDTMFAVDPAQIKAGRTMMTLDEIVQALKSLPKAPYVTFTGGDPCLHKDLGAIIPRLNMENMFVAVETQGELFPDWLSSADVVTFSPKPPSSGNVVDIDPIVEWLHKHTSPDGRRTMHVCIKIVCFDEEDLQYALTAYQQIRPTLYDAFYFTAGTPINNLEAPETPEQAEARSMNKIFGIVSGQRWLADRLMMEANTKWFNPKVHIGCQQHAIVWPEFDRGR